MPSPHSCSRFLVAVGFTLIPLVAGPVAEAQDAREIAEPAHISYVEGNATLERDGATEVIGINVPVVPGDRLATTSGRIEVAFPDGSTLDIDEYSTVDMLGPTLIRLTAGRTILAVSGSAAPAQAMRYRVDTPAASVGLDGPGEFRIAALADGNLEQTELAVIRGSATFATDGGSIQLLSGERSMAFDNREPSRPQAFNSARFDDFDRWYAGRRSARANPVATASGQNLPADLRMYSGALDAYGSWDYSVPYGYVWYPSVAADWRPYDDGYWSSVPAYGWTWVGGDAWTWPTHHYGRWGYGRGRWFWIPGRSWSTAWVSWAAAPGFVSWCPVGFDGRPVFGLSAGFVSGNSGWVAVETSSFGRRGSYGRRHSESGRRAPPPTNFAMQASAPVSPAAARPTKAPPSAGIAIQRAPSRVQDPLASINGRRAPHDEVRRQIPQSPSAAARQPGVVAPASPAAIGPLLPEGVRAPTRDRSMLPRPAPTTPSLTQPRVPDRERRPHDAPPATVEDPRSRRESSPAAPAAPEAAGPQAVPRRAAPTSQPSRSAPGADTPQATGGDSSRSAQRPSEAPGHRPGPANPGRAAPPDRSAAAGDSRAVARDQSAPQASGRRR